MVNQKILENNLKIKFNDKNLLKHALIHKSFDATFNNEKLEFIGDRVLALVLSIKLFHLYPSETEGILDKKFASLVNRKTCLKISKKLNLEEFIILGKTYQKKKSVEDKILSDACEALIGAIYLDSGYKIAEEFILKYWNSEIKKTINTSIDPKTKLQEFSLKLFQKLPNYKVVTSKGPKHNPMYKVSVKIENSKLFFGTGRSKKIAERAAASSLVKNLKLS